MEKFALYMEIISLAAMIFAALFQEMTYATFFAICAVIFKFERKEVS